MMYPTLHIHVHVHEFSDSWEQRLVTQHNTSSAAFFQRRKQLHRRWDSNPRLVATCTCTCTHTCTCTFHSYTYTCIYNVLMCMCTTCACLYVVQTCTCTCIHVYTTCKQQLYGLCVQKKQLFSVERESRGWDVLAHTIHGGSATCTVCLLVEACLL